MAARGTRRPWACSATIWPVWGRSPKRLERSARASRSCGTDWDSASAWQTLAALERQAGDHHAAWEALRECRRALDGVPGWPEVGLGRMYVEELFLLAGSAEGELAEAVFAEADRQARDVPGLPLVVLRSAAEAAGKVGDQTRAGHYRKLRDAERQRIDTAMGRAHP